MFSFASSSDHNRISASASLRGARGATQQSRAGEMPTARDCFAALAMTAGLELERYIGVEKRRHMAARGADRRARIENSKFEQGQQMRRDFPGDPQIRLPTDR